MSLADAYLVTTKNVDAFFNALLSAQAPESFGYKFLEQLDFTSSNDRLYIRVMKSLGFIDDAGTPSKRYYEFLDQTQSKTILASALREAYSDLFAINVKANEMSEDEVQNKLKTLTQGKKSDNVLRLMAKTFKALCEYADWQKAGPTIAPAIPDSKVDLGAKTEIKGEREKDESLPSHKTRTELHYNIQIHLPESRDPAVFDAIFQSLKKHLF